MSVLAIVFLAAFVVMVISGLGVTASVDMSIAGIALLAILFVSGITTVITGVWLMLIGAGVL